jgi:hypothetical protein
MNFKTFSIFGAVLVAMSTASLAQTTKRPDAGVNPVAIQGGQGQSADETRNQGQRQPQESTGPINTGSGGAPASSPQGDTPAAMQATPQGSPEQAVQGAPSNRPPSTLHGQ